VTPPGRMNCYNSQFPFTWWGVSGIYPYSRGK
jgi:hypothetical protein